MPQRSAGRHPAVIARSAASPTVAAVPAGSPYEARWSAVWAHRDDLLRIARRRTLSEGDAEDCVSEAMLRAVEHATFDVSRAGPFLTSVTVRICADLHRDRGRAARAAAVHAGDDRLGGSPETLVCDRAEAAWLAQLAAAALSPRERAVLRARADGVDPAGLTAKAAGAALARARSKLRRLPPL
jgi:RNA polymerase sigma factor (sigma-70 family)